MKTMKFRRFKADMIEQGKKTSSIRVFDDKAFAKGDELENPGYSIEKSELDHVMSDIGLSDYTSLRIRLV